MNFTACRLSFVSGLHLGERENWREGSGYLAHSDTLFGAFCHGYRLLYGEADLVTLLAGFQEGEPPFRLSSAFPYWDDIFYLPVPRCQLPRSKETKKIAFVGLSEWGRLTAGESLEALGSDAAVLPRLNVKPPRDKPWTVADIPRVGLNRFTAHPDENFFYFGETWFQEGAGLYFLFSVTDALLDKRFRAVWRLLAHEGLGGDRSVGKGQFQAPDFIPLDIPAPIESDHLVCLSLYYPGPGELAGLDQGYYDLVDRRGYIFSPTRQSFRRRPVRLFSEGSVFPCPPERRGLLVDVTPEGFDVHPVFRYGLAFTLPCRLPGGLA
jgi:CRISPR-associated protein Csm4